MFGFVDESYQPEGGYVVGAVFLPRGAADLRKRLREAFGPRFHWSEDRDTARRHDLLRFICERGLDVRAVAIRGIARKAQEKARTRCLGAVITDLAKAGGRKMTIDKRDEPWKNERDSALIESYLARGILAPEFGHEFKKPPAEPILWIADAVAGAIQAYLRDADPQYIEALRTQLRLRML